MDPAISKPKRPNEKVRRELSEFMYSFHEKKGILNWTKLNTGERGSLNIPS